MMWLRTVDLTFFDPGYPGCRIRFLVIFSLLAFLLMPSVGLGQSNGENPTVVVTWSDRKPVGRIEIRNGELSDLKILQGQGNTGGERFSFKSVGANRLQLTFSSANTDAGPGSTLVTVYTDQHPFSFFLRDVTREYPIFIPEYRVVVVQDGDPRSYEEVEEEIQKRGLSSKLDQIEAEPEASFESAARITRNQSVPTWLGISRDMRIFQITQSLADNPKETDLISPKNSSTDLKLPETGDRPVNYQFIAGRGQGVESNVTRRLEDGVLPILHSTLLDGEIRYQSTCFVSLESRPLTPETPIGTDFLVADNASAGHMFTEQQKQVVAARLKEHENQTPNGQTVLYYRVIATNTGKIPRYAWYKTPSPGRGWWDRFEYSFDSSTGFSSFGEDRVFCISKIDGRPLPNEEMAVLVRPDETVVFEFKIPHSPISEERAVLLAGQSFEERFAEIKTFWRNKLNKAARVRLPEKRMEEMIRAGLLHLDLITYGKEPEGTLAPLIGIYSPIGTESSPIIQFYNSMGWEDVARRSLTYFLDKQHEDGLIQNFGGYMVETGAALWSIGEYYRYTRDLEWIDRIKPKLLKSCDYLLDWRNQNKLDDLRGRGYGMISGKVADPEDPFHQFMLNAYGYLGVSRIAEILEPLDPATSGRLADEAESWKQDILDSFYHSMAHSPVIPLGDGTWCPTAAPWTEATGPRALYVDREKFFSHGTFTVPDVLLGPMYLVFCEILDPDSMASHMMLRYHSELFYQNQSVFSQPYYSRHNWVQLKQGRVKAFLKTYYHTVSALADRETYTFWEHLYHASPHKTHEEGWFLMETRWMLYLEDGRDLHLLPGAPRKWLEAGQIIELENVASYFGPVSFKVRSHIREGLIEANIRCDSDRKPERIIIRLPHPDGKAAIRVEGGHYDEETETVTIDAFGGEAEVLLYF